MVLKLHGLALSPNVVRVIAVLNEKGLDYEFVSVDMRAGGHKKPEFLSLNPFGQVPAFEDGDLKLFEMGPWAIAPPCTCSGPALTPMTESRAISRYLAIQYKESGTDLLPARTQADLAATEVWLEVEAQHFHQPISKLCFELLVKPVLGMVTDEAVADAQAAELAKVLDVLEDRLSKSKYFGGDEFTLADLNHMPYTDFVMKTSKSGLITSRPHLKAWWETVSARPAWLKTVAAAAVAAAY